MIYFTTAKQLYYKQIKTDQKETLLVNLQSARSVVADQEYIYILDNSGIYQLNRSALVTVLNVRYQVEQGEICGNNRDDSDEDTLTDYDDREDCFVRTGIGYDDAGISKNNICVADSIAERPEICVQQYGANRGCDKYMPGCKIDNKVICDNNCQATINALTGGCGNEFLNDDEECDAGLNEEIQGDALHGEQGENNANCGQEQQYPGGLKMYTRDAFGTCNKDCACIPDIGESKCSQQLGAQCGYIDENGETNACLSQDPECVDCICVPSQDFKIYSERLDPAFGEKITITYKGETKYLNTRICNAGYSPDSCAAIPYCPQEGVLNSACMCSAETFTSEQTLETGVSVWCNIKCMRGETQNYAVLWKTDIVAKYSESPVYTLSCPLNLDLQIINDYATELTETKNVLIFLKNSWECMTGPTPPPSCPAPADQCRLDAMKKEIEVSKESIDIIDSYLIIVDKFYNEPNKENMKLAKDSYQVKAEKLKEKIFDIVSLMSSCL